MRVLVVVLSLLLAGCGGATPVLGFTCDADCEAAFARVTAIEVSSGGLPSGSFQLTRDGLSERQTYTSGDYSRKRGAQLTREQLAPLWRIVGAPGFVELLRAFRDTRTFASQTDVSHCFTARTATGAGTACWRGPPPAGDLGRAWNESVAAFRLAFPQ